MSTIALPLGSVARPFRPAMRIAEHKLLTLFKWSAVFGFPVVWRRDQLPTGRGSPINSTRSVLLLQCMGSKGSAQTGCFMVGPADSGVPDERPPSNALPGVQLAALRRTPLRQLLKALWGARHCCLSLFVGERPTCQAPPCSETPFNECVGTWRPGWRGCSALPNRPA